MPSTGLEGKSAIPQNIGGIPLQNIGGIQPQNPVAFQPTNGVNAPNLAPVPAPAQQPQQPQNGQTSGGQWDQQGSFVRAPLTAKDLERLSQPQQVPSNPAQLTVNGQQPKQAAPQPTGQQAQTPAPAQPVPPGNPQIEEEEKQRGAALIPTVQNPDTPSDNQGQHQPPPQQQPSQAPQPQQPPQEPVQPPNGQQPVPQQPQPTPDPRTAGGNSNTISEDNRQTKTGGSPKPKHIRPAQSVQLSDDQQQQS